MVSPVPTGPAPKLAPAAEGKGFLDFLEMDVDSEDLDEVPAKAAPAQGNAPIPFAMGMPMPVPSFVLPNLPHALHVSARPIQLPGLPAGPDAPTVEVLTQPAPPQGEVAFQLQMTAPKDAPPADALSELRRAELPGQPRRPEPKMAPRRPEPSSDSPLPEITAQPRRPEPLQAHPVSHAAAAGTPERKAPMPISAPQHKRPQTPASMSHRPAADMPHRPAADMAPQPAADTAPQPTPDPTPQTSVITQAVSTPADAPADPVAPPQEVAPARPVEVVEEAPRPATPAQHIALRVKSVDDRSVDVRLTSRAGEVHVSVHTPDAALARTMRTELGTLTGKLSQAGFGVQGVAANSTESSSSSDQRESNPDHNRDARHYQQQHEQQQDAQQNRRGRRQVPFLFDWEFN